MRSVRYFPMLLGVLLWLAASTLNQPPPLVPLERPFVGIFYRETPTGIEITQVMPGSPAEQAGLQVGDLISAVDGQSVTAQSLAQVIQSKQIGDTLLFSIVRGGQTREIPVILGIAPNPMQPQPEIPFMPTPNPLQIPPTARLGVFLRTAPEGDGVTILEVEANSIAAEVGLQVGDVIRAVNGTPITSASQSAALIRAARGPITLTIDREGETLTFEINLTRANDGSAIRIPPVGRPPIPAAIERDVLGITVAPVERGLQINSLQSDSPAERAGLSMRDIITAVNGVPVMTIAALQAELQGKLGAGAFTITVIRNGETLDLTVEPLIEAISPLSEPIVITGAVIYLNNVRIWEVQAIREGNPFYSAGLREGDRITLINGEPFNYAEIGNLMRRALAGETFTLTVERGDQTLEITAVGTEVMLELLVTARPNRLIPPRTPRP